jgi:glycosyltransferase involved in cell wall biosynthesis
MDIRRKYKLAIISSHNIKDIKKLSGTGYYMTEAIKKYIGEVDIVEPLLPYKLSLVYFLKNFDIVACVLWCKAVQMIWNIRGKQYHWERTLLLSRLYAKHLKRRLAGKGYNFVFADKGSIVIANLVVDIPILYCSDATFSLMVNYYPAYTNLSEATLLQGNRIEAMAIQKASACLYRSEWAARSAVEDYGADPEKVFVSSFGPNIKERYIPDNVNIDKRIKEDKCNLLLVGVDWDRKGCDIAIETTKILRSYGIDAELTICGCKNPPNVALYEHVRITPFLNKKNPDDIKRLIDLYNQTSFLIFPSIAEAFGIVILEAFAFAIPVVASNTGGISSIVQQGNNGQLIEDFKNPKSFAAVIEKIFTDKHLYRKYAEQARKYYEQKGNWCYWAKIVKEAIESCLKNRKTK